MLRIIESILVVIATFLLSCSSNNGLDGQKVGGPPGTFAITRTIPQPGQITLYWSDSSNVTQYVVQYGTSSGSYTASVTNDGESPLTITGLSNGTQYYFLITAVNILGAATATSSEVPNTTLSWDYKGTPGFTLGEANTVSVASDSNGNPYVAEQDLATGNATVMEYSSGTWASLGSSPINTDKAINLQIALDSDDTPYIAYQDISQFVSVMKYSNGTWSNVGNSGFATNGSGNFAFALNSKGTPFVAMQDSSSSDQLTVLTYNGSSWVNLGSVDVTTGSVSQIAMAFDSNDDPFVAFSDSSNSSKATVMTYSSGAWSVVGSAGFSTNAVTQMRLALDPSNTPYVAFDDNAIGATVMNYSGGTWSLVGSEYFSAGTVSSLSLSVYSTGTPYVAYSDGGNNSRLTVMSYQSGVWSAVVGAGFTADEVDAVSMTMDPTGIPLVAASEYALEKKASVFQGIYVTPAFNIGWTTTYPSSSTTLAPNWTVSTDPTLTNQYVQLYSDEFCLNSNGSEVNLSSTSSETTSLTGTAGSHSSYRVLTSYSSQDSIWSACSTLMGVTSLFEYAGSTINPLSASGSIPAIAIDKTGIAYVAFKDASTGQLDVLELDDGTWSEIGHNISAGTVASISITTDLNNIPYVAYSDGSVSSKLTVQTYTSSTWSTVGSAGISADAATNIVMATDPTGVPYVVFEDSVTDAPTVMSYVSSAWGSVGTISATTSLTPAIAFDTANHPYVAYLNSAGANSATVVEYLSPNWNAIGSADFSDAAAGVSLVIDSSNNPYVAIIDTIASSKVSVYEYTSSTWGALGSTAFSTAATGSLQLKLDSSNNPYVSYQDSSTSDAAVYKYASSTWSSMGAFGYGGGGLSGPIGMALDNNGYPWVTYGVGSLTELISVREYHP